MLRLKAHHTNCTVILSPQAPIPVPRGSPVVARGAQAVMCGCILCVDTCTIAPAPHLAHLGYHSEGPESRKKVLFLPLLPTCTVFHMHNQTWPYYLYFSLTPLVVTGSCRRASRTPSYHTSNTNGIYDVLCAIGCCVCVWTLLHVHTLKINAMN